MTAPRPPTPSGRLGRLLSHTKGTIFRGSAAAATSLAITSVAGAIFWAIAARITSQADVGRAAALTTLVTFIVYLSATSLIAVVARYGSGDDLAQRVVLNLSFVSAAALAAVCSLVVCLVAVVAGISQLVSLRSPAGVIAFTGIAVGAAWSFIVEIRLLAEKRYQWMIVRAVIVNVTGIALLVFAGMGSSPLKLFIASNGVVALSGPVTWFLSQRRKPHWLALRPLPANFRDVRRFAGVAVPSTIVGQMAIAGLPAVVAFLVAPAANAQFYVAWSVNLLAVVIFLSVGNALLVQGGEGDVLRAQIRQSLRLVMVLSGLVTAGMVVLSPCIPLIYGPRYAESARLVRWFSLTTLPLAIYVLTLTTARIRHRRRAMIGLPVLLAIGVLGTAIPLSRAFSIQGATAAWLVGVGTGGLVSYFVLRSLVRSLTIGSSDVLEALEVVRSTSSSKARG